MAETRVDSLEEILNKVVIFLRQRIQLEAVFLFGSQASEDADADSDVDIAAFSPDVDNMDLEQRASLTAEVELACGIGVELHLFPSKALREARPTNFPGHILKTGRRVA